MGNYCGFRPIYEFKQLIVSVFMSGSLYEDIVLSGLLSQKLLIRTILQFISVKRFFDWIQVV